MHLTSRLAATVAFALVGACSHLSEVEPPLTSSGPLYVLEKETVLPSTDSDWDYIKLDHKTSRLFLARRKDGLTVFDVKSRKAIGTVANSEGANGPLLLPHLNRGYSAMTDGSLLSFKLDSLEVIERLPLASDGGLNGAIYDPSTKHIHVVTGVRSADATWFTLDAATGKLLGKKVFPFRKMDDASPDGKGHLYAPARYDNILLTLNSQTLAEESRWNINCDQVVAVEYQKETDRILVGCRGDKPVFLALDAQSGREVARLPIGAGIDGLGVDESRHSIVTTNGGDASMSVIRQEGPDAYTLLGNVQTRPQARVMQIDEHTGKVYTVSADATFGPAPADGSKPEAHFHKNTFTVLEYTPQ
jgi:hypothetical protein